MHPSVDDTPRLMPAPLVLLGSCVPVCGSMPAALVLLGSMCASIQVSAHVLRCFLNLCCFRVPCSGVVVEPKGLSG